MKRLALFVVCVLALGMAQAQTVSKETADQFRQLMKMDGQSFVTVSNQLTEWGFTHNESVTDMFTMQMHQFYRTEGQDTVLATLGVIGDVVYSLGGIVAGMEAARIYPLIGKAGAMQQQKAEELGLTKYVCSVKGKNVTNKFPKSHAELEEVLAEMSEETVSWIFEQWKGADGKATMTLVYDNKLFGKKKTRRNDRVELSMGLGVTPGE